jgi:hypothetical protein
MVLTGFPGGIAIGDAESVFDVVPGLPGIGTLRVAADVVAEETVTIGTDVFRVAVVLTDSTEDAANGELNNTDEDVVITFPAHGLIGGDLVGCQSELAVVTNVLGPNRIALHRGVSGTTIAAHADGQTLLTEAEPGDGGIAVGMGATLTPTVFTARLVADINNRGTTRVTAQLIDVNTIALYTSAVRGSGDVRPTVESIATTETLDGSGNAFDAATLSGGRVSSPVIPVVIVPTAVEVTEGKIRRYFPGTPEVLLTLVSTVSTGAAVVWDGAVTVAGGRVTWDNAGSVDWAATSRVLAFVALK